MNEGLNQPQNPRNRKSRRRRRNFGGQNQGQNQGQNGPGNQGQGRPGGQNRQNRNNRGPRRSGPAFVGPMDHSYRSQGNGNSQQGARFHNGVQASPNMEPLTQRVDAPTRIFAFVEDLFFVAKIQEISRKLNVKVEFVKTDKDIAEKTEGSEDKPSLIIVDLNSNGIKPLPVITKMRSKYKKATSIVGFVSHVQGDLKVKAQEAGCDVVMPRSAFSQNLASILRRHGAEDEPEDNFNRV
ncbi:MAG TPA: response regulator [Candidatus Angelobacter sp.]|jgi:CheY-like chemotaxis protein